MKNLKYQRTKSDRGSHSGCKIYHGPYVYNFQEIYQILHKNKISYKINTTNELAYRIIDDNKSKYKKKIFSKLMKDISDKILKELWKI